MHMSSFVNFTLEMLNSRWRVCIRHSTLINDMAKIVKKSLSHKLANFRVSNSNYKMTTELIMMIIVRPINQPLSCEYV